MCPKMNCPHHRSNLEYIPDLSSPNSKNPKDKWLSYYCDKCKAIFRFQDFQIVPSIRGVKVFKICNLNRIGFIQSHPLSDKVSDTALHKRERQLSALKQGRLKKHPPSIIEIPTSKRGGFLNDRPLSRVPSSTQPKKR